VVYGNLKTLVVKLASDTVHEQLFSVLVPGYSMEPHSVLEHIWQSYVDDSGVPVRQNAQVYYTTFLNALRPFYDLVEDPIDLAGVFMAHIEPTLTKSFQVHYPDFGQARKRTAIIQRRILMDMLKALIRAEADVSNILEVVSADKRRGEQFHVKPSAVPAYLSVAEQTINSYTPGGGDALKSVETEGKDLSCFGCGHPHLWSKKVNGKWVVICPNKDQPGVRERVKLTILQYQTRQRKKTRKNQKRKNVHTLNLEDLPQSTQDRILFQHRTKASGATTNATSVSVSSLITGATGSVRTGVKRGSITLHQDVVVLASNSTKPPIPIAINSPMAHLTLQTGTSTEDRDCPGLKCVFDSGAALSTTNFHFIEAVIWQFPHILKKIYLPEDYAAIVLLGIVYTPDLAPVTMELTVWFDIHLPYSTKDGNTTSLLVAAGPDVAVNIVLGIPFITATGMVANFLNNVCEAKNLLCEPFPINFKCATKSIPVFQSSADCLQCLGTEVTSNLHVLGLLRSYYDKSRNGELPHIIWQTPEGSSNSCKRAAEPLGGKLVAKAVSFHDCWISPGPPADKNCDYKHQVL
jgi:hypothetical protein